MQPARAASLNGGLAASVARAVALGELPSGYRLPRPAQGFCFSIISAVCNSLAVVGPVPLTNDGASPEVSPDVEHRDDEDPREAADDRE